MPSQRLYTGGDHRFLQALRRELVTAVDARLAVAFVMQSGVALLAPALRAALLRPGQQVRVLTTDYLGVTEPEALEALLALPAVAGARLDLRAYAARRHSFHPKAYLFRHAGGQRRAFIGSSNLSASALQHGVEWNWATLETPDGAAVADAEQRFDDLFDSPNTVAVTPEWIDGYRRRRPTLAREAFGLGGAPGMNTGGYSGEYPAVADYGTTPDAAPGTTYGATPGTTPSTTPGTTDSATPPPTPNPAQELALQALTDLREAGEDRALVVAATGLGKTFLAAFDSRGYRRVLFIAHRQELLDQARAAFESVRDDRVGRVQAAQVELDARVVVAMVQTLAQERVLADARLAGFDYVVVDEFHHAAADSYQKVLAVLQPRFLLGLTATPFRGDTRDLFALVGGNVAYEVDLFQAVAYGWLVPFHYYGIADTVKYSPALLNASRTGYDEAKLTAEVSRAERLRLVMEQWHKHAPAAPKALGFCVSIEHARTMAASFNAAGIPALAVHSGADSVDRRDAIHRLQEGSVHCLFTVDLFNEGVDIPAVNLVLMLRPTESMTVFVQQLGRGLRLHPHKQRLVVLDLIGNHRHAHVKLAFLAGQQGREVHDTEAHRKAYAELSRHAGELELEGGIRIQLERQALETLNEALRAGTHLRDALKADLAAVGETTQRQHGRRPWLDELRLLGAYAVRAQLKQWQGWAGALQVMGWATDTESQLAAECGGFLRELETTAMTKSYKMVVLQTMLDAERGLRPVQLEELATAFRHHFQQARFMADIRGTEIEDIEHVPVAKLEAYVRSNPVKAWASGHWFAFDSETRTLSYTGPVPKDTKAFRDAVAERATWRLNQYIDRHEERLPSFKLLPNGAGSGACVMFGAKPVNALDAVPRGTGWQPVEIVGETFYGKFVKVALNVLKTRPVDNDAEPNLLTAQLARLFGVAPGELLAKPRRITLHRREDGTCVMTKGGNS